MEYINIGSNCSVTWWLNVLNLREQAYPFDWANITIRQLNTILKNKFTDYVSSLEVKFISDKFPDEYGNSTAVITNKYGIKFAHEVLTNDLIEFSKSLENRIIRFNDISKKDFITYVRIELKPIKSSYLAELHELIKLLDLINPNYIIKLIIHSETNIKISLDKIEIFYFDSFSPDWKMNHIDWKSILTN